MSDPPYTTWKYGVKFKPLLDAKGRPAAARPDWMIERDILREYDKAAASSEDVMTWEQHFEKFVEIIWNNPNTSEGSRFVWNPYARKILNKARTAKFLGVAGHASSSKSHTGAMLAVANFLIGGKGPEGGVDPKFFKAFVTSTTLEESRGRIWGTIETYWKEAIKFFGGEHNLPGKLVTSRGKIQYRDPITGKPNDLAGIALIAGGKGHDGDAATKIGFKAPKMMLIADELPMLTHGLYKAASTNLFSNPDFQMIGIGNPDSIFDPFGLFIEPKDGWASIDDNSDGWETKMGYCIRFDGELSPNVLAGREIYPGLLTKEKVEHYRRSLGEKSPGYYRMVRGFISPTGSIDSIYTEQELTSSGASKPCNKWVDVPKQIGFLDPAFSHGGDRAVATFCKVGKIQHPISKRIITALELVHSEDLMLRVDAKHKTQDRNTQLVNLFISECRTRGIANEDAGLDATGGGDPLYSIMCMLGGSGWQYVSFGGAPSEMPISMTDKRKGKDRYLNRVSELWYNGKDLLAGNQIFGLDPQLMSEMSARTYKGTGEKEKVRVETKADMKKRTGGKSPDFADSFFGCVDIARRRHGLIPEGKPGAKPQAPKQVNKDPFGGHDWATKKRSMFDSYQQGSLTQTGAGWAE